MDEFDKLAVGPRKGERSFPAPRKPPRPLPRRQCPPCRPAKKAVEGDPVVGIRMPHDSHLPLNHRPDVKFLPKETTQSVFHGLPPRPRPPTGNPQSSPEPIGRPAHQEQPPP